MGTEHHLELQKKKILLHVENSQIAQPNSLYTCIETKCNLMEWICFRNIVHYDVKSECIYKRKAIFTIPNEEIGIYYVSDFCNKWVAWETSAYQLLVKLNKLIGLLQDVFKVNKIS